MKRPRTASVRQQIQGTPWSQCQKIENLLFLEDTVVTGSTSRGQAQMYFALRDSAVYGPHYRSIRDELEPGWQEAEARAAAEEAQKLAEEEARWAEERAARRRQEVRDRELWGV